MKTDMELRKDRAKELGIYYSQSESETRTHCGCGYKGYAEVIAYSEYDKEMIDMVICPGCGSA